MTELPDRAPIEATVSEAADLLEALLRAVESGDLEAPPAFVTRLEGGLVALREVERGAQS